MPEPNAERRSEPRRTCAPSRVIRVLVYPNVHPENALVRNVSARGIALLLARPLERDAILAVQPLRLQRQGAYLQVARVTSVRRCGKRAWMHGCQFARPLSAEGLAALA